MDAWLYYTDVVRKMCNHVSVIAKHRYIIVPSFVNVIQLNSVKGAVFIMKGIAIWVICLTCMIPQCAAGKTLCVVHCQAQKKFTCFHFTYLTKVMQAFPMLLVCFAQ